MTTKMQFPRLPWVCRAAVFVFALGVAGSCLAAVTAGSTAPNFTIRNHKTGQALQLYQYRGNIIVLDFWAYWCGPCQSAAADMEPYIVQYYRTNGGNRDGIPVQAMSISVDLSDPVAAENFIKTYGLELVGDDNTGTYQVYGDGYIPYMVVINGTTNSTNKKTWETLYSTSGYNRTAIKTAVDSVLTPAPTVSVGAPTEGSLVAPPHVSLSASVDTRGKVIKRVEFYTGTTLIGLRTNTPYSLTWSNVPLGSKTVFARAVYGASGHVDSAPVSFTVGNPMPIGVSAEVQGAELKLTWSGDSGQFRVQVATDLATPSWEYLTAASTNTTAVISRTNTSAFYRVVRQ